MLQPFKARDVHAEISQLGEKTGTNVTAALSPPVFSPPGFSPPGLSPPGGEPSGGCYGSPDPCIPRGGTVEDGECVFGDHCTCRRGYVCSNTGRDGECDPGSGADVYCVKEEESKCAKFCQSNKKNWKKKCKWDSCSACQECDVTPGCKPFCHNHGKIEARKCKWKSCSACSACTEPEVCPEMYEPVCCGGENFGNECKAGLAGHKDGCLKGECPKPDKDRLLKLLNHLDRDKSGSVRFEELFEDLIEEGYEDLKDALESGEAINPEAAELLGTDPGQVAAIQHVGGAGEQVLREVFNMIDANGDEDLTLEELCDADLHAIRMKYQIRR